MLSRKSYYYYYGVTITVLLLLRLWIWVARWQNKWTMELNLKLQKHNWSSTTKLYMIPGDSNPPCDWNPRPHPWAVQDPCWEPETPAQVDKWKLPLQAIIPGDCVKYAHCQTCYTVTYPDSPLEPLWLCKPKFGGGGPGSSACALCTLFYI